MSILTNFGLRVKELRMKSGMTQEMLALRSGLDRSYIGGVERGERNVSLQNIEKLSGALDVDISYLFNDERFLEHSAFLKNDLSRPLEERFVLEIDYLGKVIAWQVKGVLNAKDMEKISSDLKQACSQLTKGNIRLLMDYRSMVAEGQPYIFSPEVNVLWEQLQVWMVPYCCKAVVLCNSMLMKHQLERLGRRSGLAKISSMLYEEGKDLVREAYRILKIPSNPLVWPEDGDLNGRVYQMHPTRG
ncbi:helix-turn-helix domain-containing protein [Paenibacillus sp. y28]|uniref:helix-turn-helix domain-containing protein n=1 Tax=Paenibacillus sp. y28 TaxID=3129110 RepID=UPI0030158A97